MDDDAYPFNPLIFSRFKQAGVQWGQKLPSITDDTHKEISKRFDYWEENGSMDGYEYGVSKE